MEQKWTGETRVFVLPNSGTPNTVTLQNGSTIEFVVDGCGTLYKAIADVRGANVELVTTGRDNQSATTSECDEVSRAMRANTAKSR